MWRDMDKSRKYQDLDSAINYVRAYGVRKYKDVGFKM